MEGEGKRGFDYKCSRSQKQRGKSLPRTDDFFDGHLGVKIATVQVRKGNTFPSSDQASNSVDWEIDELKVSKRHAVAF